LWAYFFLCRWLWAVLSVRSSHASSFLSSQSTLSPTPAPSPFSIPSSRPSPHSSPYASPPATMNSATLLSSDRPGNLSCLDLQRLSRRRDERDLEALRREGQRAGASEERRGSRPAPRTRARVLPARPHPTPHSHLLYHLPSLMALGFRSQMRR
jgi:hypothetical protein